MFMVIRIMFYIMLQEDEKTNIVDQLLNAGADIHAGDDAALYIAYLTGDFNMSKHLLKKGARLKAVEKKLLRKLY